MTLVDVKSQDERRSGSALVPETLRGPRQPEIARKTSGSAEHTRSVLCRGLEVWLGVLQSKRFSGEQVVDLRLGGEFLKSDPVEFQKVGVVTFIRVLSL